MLLNLLQHLVEGIREQTQFVRAEFFGPDGIIPPVGNGLGGLGEGEDGFGNLMLQLSGKQVGRQNDNRNRRQGDADGDAQPFMLKRPHVKSEVERAQSFAALHHGLEFGQIGMFRLNPVLLRCGGQDVVRQVCRIL